MKEKWHYIGDGVYVMFDGYHVNMITGTPFRPENVIYLEPEVRANLVSYLTKLDEPSEAQTEEPEDCSSPHPETGAPGNNAERTPA